MISLSLKGYGFVGKEFVRLMDYCFYELQKNIVILSDGEPTYSHPFVATATYEGCERLNSYWCGNYGPRDGRFTNVGAFTPDYNTEIGSGNSFTMNYNAYVNATCTEHGTTSRLSYGVYALDGTVTQTSGTNNGVAPIGEANQAKTAGEMLNNLFAFCEEVFPEGQELLILVTELTINYYAATFISRYGCDAYFTHNQELLFYERQQEIISQLESLELN